MNVNRIKYVPAAVIVIVLSACNGSNSAPVNPDASTLGDAAPLNDNSMEARQWIKTPDEYGYDLGIFEKDGVVYTSTHSTRDGFDFQSYHTPELNILAQYRFLSYIDENNKFYLFGGITATDVIETDRWTFVDRANFGDIRYMAGTSDFLISASYQANGPVLGPVLRDVVEFSVGNAFEWREIVLSNGENIVTNGVARLASNGLGTMVLTDANEGAWITKNGGQSWEKILENMGYLDLTVGSDDYASEFYAFSNRSARFSGDGGETWSDISVPDFEADRWVAGAIDSSNGDVVIYGIDGPDNSDDYIFKSNDKGVTWIVVGPRTPGSACVLCAVPDVVVNEYGYFVSADDLYFLTK